MAGKHRKSSRPSSVVARVVAPGGLAAAAVTATSLSTALMTGTTTAAAPVAVDLLAVVAAANSTSQIFAGTTYYGTDYGNGDYGEVQVVPFLSGPQGIAVAISTASSNLEPGEPLIVLASGWGAGQTGTALGQLSQAELDSIDLVILDNNTNRAGGGFWTTYAPFAPLLLTSADPTPTDLDGVTVLDVGYEYNFNSSAPVDPLNPFSLGNSLAAYAFGYGAEATALDIDQEDDGTVILHQANGSDITLVPGTHYVVEDGNVVRQHSAGGTAENPNNSTIYVTVDSGDLPLTRPLRLIPVVGDIVADALDPTLTELVNSGYDDGLGEEGNEAIPLDPTVPRPMQPGSSLGNLDDVPGTLQTGLDAGVQTAQEDVSNPTNFVTKPLGEVGKLPVLGSLVSLPTTTSSTTSQTTRLANNSPNKFFPGANNNAAASSSGTSSTANPGQRFADRINDAVNRVTGGLQRNESGEDSSEESGED